MAREVATGVYRLGTKWANFYVLVEGADALVVDAGYPSYFNQVTGLFDELGLSLSAIAAVVVTHHHVDHAGTAERIRSRAHSRVLVHESDEPKVTGAQRSHVPPGFYRQSWRPSMFRYLVHTVAAGGARYRPVAEVARMEERQALDLPGRPMVVFTPGHTAGHCSLLARDRGVLFAGDALVNFDYASGTPGLSLHRFNEDRAQASASLARLADIDAETVLFGHGEPWSGSPRSAVEAAGYVGTDG